MDNGAERTEWPTEQKLAGLRAKGIVAISGPSIFYAGILGFIIGLSIVSARIESLNDFLKQAILEGRTPSQQILGEILLVLAVPTLSAFLVTALVGLLQSKFLFRLSAIGFKFERLAPGQWWQSLRGRFLEHSFVALFWLTLALIVAAATGLIAFREFLTLLNQDVNWVPLRIESIAIPLLWTVSALAVGLVIAAWLIERFRFMIRHRMTRQEFERESEELHIS